MLALVPSIGLTIRVKPATRPIARFSSRLAALLLLAGPGPLRPRALPANSKTAHSDVFN
jgi:hypothetical protein